MLQSSFADIERACCVGDQCDTGIPRVREGIHPIAASERKKGG